MLCSILSVGAGSLLSDEGVCEIMQSCFRICFEERLSGQFCCHHYNDDNDGIICRAVALLC